MTTRAPIKFSRFSAPPTHTEPMSPLYRKAVLVALCAFLLVGVALTVMFP